MQIKTDLNLPLKIIPNSDNHSKRDFLNNTFIIGALLPIEIKKEKPEFEEILNLCEVNLKPDSSLFEYLLRHNTRIRNPALKTQKNVVW